MYPPILSICFRSLRFFAVAVMVLAGAKESVGQSPIRHYLMGQKTANTIQSGNLIGLGVGTAGAALPMISYREGCLVNEFRYYYGNTDILNGSTISGSTLTAARTVGVAGLLGSGADIYIQFRNTNNAVIEAGTTTYIKLKERPTNTGINLALGGLLGLFELNSISGRGYINAGNYIFHSGGWGVLCSNPYNGNENVGSPAGTLNGTKTRLLIDVQGEWYAAVTPDEDYNSIRINVSYPNDLNLLSLTSELKTNVYNAFTELTGDQCSTHGRYTSPGEATGISLNTGVLGLQINELIANPHFALDESPDLYASYSSGVASVGVANTVSQTIYFDHSASGSDGVNVRLGLSNSLIGLDLIALNGITFTAYNGSNDTPVWQSGLGDLAQLLGLDLLNLINIGGSHKELNITFKPEASFDRIKLELNKGLLGIDVIGDALRVYHVKLAPAAPEILSPVDQPTDVNSCEHETATFSVTASVPTGSITQYEWQYFNGITWIIAEGVNNQREYSINNTPLVYNNRIYRVAITGGISGCEQTVYSNEALLTVRPQPGRPQLSITSPSN